MSAYVMKNVLIFGNSGSGKSTLAQALSAQEGLQHLDLDSVAWQAESPPQRKPLAESEYEIDAFRDRFKAWVIEGCYADLLELLLPHASEIVFMDLPTSVCIENARSRPWEPHKYPSKTAQDANLPMLEAWIADYETREDVFSKRAHEALYNSFKGPKRTVFENRTDLKDSFSARDAG